MTTRTHLLHVRPPVPLQLLGAFSVAALVSATYIVIVRDSLGTLFWAFDEAWFMLDARLILKGFRPFVDFAYHQPPLHLYLLALSGKVFGQTVSGFRMLSLLSVAASGFLLFCLTRPLVGFLPAVVAEAVFLFTPAQMGALGAAAETPMVVFTLLGVVFLFVGRGRSSAYASGLAFVVALLIKPTCLLMVLAAALSLVYARAWRRLGDLAVAGVVAAAVGLGSLLVLSHGIFADTITYHVAHLGARSVGMWTSIDSGFAEMRSRLGIDTPTQWALYCFTNAYELPWAYLSISLLGLSILGIPMWVTRCARSRPALRAFTVLWPMSYVLLNFAAVDFVSAEYFVPYFAFSAFLIAGLVWQATRYVTGRVAAVAGIVACVALGSHLALIVGRYSDVWYYGRTAWISQQYQTVVSFTPMLFAATGREPGCGLENPALTYGSFGEFLGGRLSRFRVSDERLVECLKANRATPIVIDWAFYFFTRPGSLLREYLHGEGSEQRLFFSPAALEQWDRPGLSMPSGR